MTRNTTLLLGAGTGTAAGLLVIVVVWIMAGDGSAPSGAPVPGEAMPPVMAAGKEVRAQDLQPVALFFQGTDEFLLRPEVREIFWTAQVTDRARQVVAELLRGPQAADRLPLLPEGFTLREVYVMPGGIAWVDLGSGGSRPTMGSRQERAAVEGIALSLTANFSEIERVGLLIDGGQVESLAGHLDLRITYTGASWLPPGARVDDLLPAEVVEARRAAEAGGASGIGEAPGLSARLTGTPEGAIEQ